MGRTKQTPTKRENLYMNLSTVGEYHPKVKRKKAKPPKERRIPSHQLIIATEEHKQLFLGEILIGSTSNVFPEHVKACKISFIYVEERESYDIVLNLDDACTVIHTLEDVSYLKEFVQSRVFSFELYAQEENVYVRVYLTSIPLPKYLPKLGKCIKTAFQLFYDVDIDKESVINRSRKRSSLSNIELNELYHILLGKRDNFQQPSTENIDFTLLKPKLRPYQEKAVKWMIYRESVADDLNGDIHPLYKKITLKSGLDVYLDKYTGWVEKSAPIIQGNWKGGILADEMGLGKTVEVLALILGNRMDRGMNINTELSFNEDENTDEKELVIEIQPKKRKIIKEEDDIIVPEKKNRMSEKGVKGSSQIKSANYQALESIYYRTLSEYCTTKPREPADDNKVQCLCGGNVDKGLVECEICGKWQHSSCLGWKRQLGSYKCPQCWKTMDPIESRATLIVAPAALRQQWCRELTTHLKPGLKVLNYEGYSATPVYPTELQNYDIVITTYAVLQAEMRLTETDQFFNLRKQRKYWPGGSPLIRIKWWRLCLDEAQTVEMPGRTVSAMARKIPACHRWAVTGTPMAKGVTDIHGLIDYLQMEPYNDVDTWNHILLQPYLRGEKEPMINFLSKVLWRTSKESVLDQINIPKQTFEMHTLEFSAVEKFFYNREHEICARDFLHIATKFDSNLFLEKMDKSDLNNLMGPLLSLRQACSDPSAVRGKGRYLSLKKNASSMKELLEALILKNKSDCEESLRLIVSSINGLAGIYLLMNKPEQAITEYRKVLQLAARFSQEEKEGKLTIDKLPLIHAMYNLAEVLETHPTQEYTLRDSRLREDCADVEKQYIEKFMKETAACKETCRTFTNTVKGHEDKITLNYGQWYSDGLDWVENKRFDDDLSARIEIAAANANVDCDLRAHTTRTLLRAAYTWHVSLDESRKALFDAIDALYYEDPHTKNIIIKDRLVPAAMDCHLRPQQQKGKKRSAKCPVCIANARLKEYEATLFQMQKRAGDFEEMGLVGSWKPTFEELLLKALLGLLKARNSKPDLVKDGEAHGLLIEALKKEFKEIRKLWTMLDRQVCARDELDICKVKLQLKTGDDSKDKANRVLKNLSYEQAVTNETINLLRPSELPHQELILRSEESRNHMRLEALLGTRNYLGTLRQQQFEGCSPDLCPVCRGPLVNNWAILPCAHTFCLECFKTLLDKAILFMHCCVCRAKHKLQDVAYIRSGGAADNQSDDIPVVGNYSRKIEDVVRVLLNLRKTDSYVKVLLFSTWPLILKLLKKALEDNDIRVELAQTSASFEKKVEKFKDPIKKITVLLLPIRLGSKGLNLIEATHVILLEPVLNPADELQAIGRVHRIGQTKPTVVHKFLVRNTIEESLHNATSSNAAFWEKGMISVEQLKELFTNSYLDEEESEPIVEDEVNGGFESDPVLNEETHQVQEDLEEIPKNDERFIEDQSCGNGEIEVELSDEVEQDDDSSHVNKTEHDLTNQVQEVEQEIPQNMTVQGTNIDINCSNHQKEVKLLEGVESCGSHELQDPSQSPCINEQPRESPVLCQVLKESCDVLNKEEKNSANELGDSVNIPKEKTNIDVNRSNHQKEVKLLEGVESCGSHELQDPSQSPCINEQPRESPVLCQVLKESYDVLNKEEKNSANELGDSVNIPKEKTNIDVNRSNHQKEVKLLEGVESCGSHELQDPSQSPCINEQPRESPVLCQVLKESYDVLNKEEDNSASELGDSGNTPKEKGVVVGGVERKLDNPWWF